MKTTTLAADEVRRTIGKIVKDLADGDSCVMVSYHGVPAAAIVPIHGLHGHIFAQAIKDAGKEEK